MPTMQYDTTGLPGRDAARRGAWPRSCAAREKAAILADERVPRQLPRTGDVPGACMPPMPPSVPRYSGSGRTSTSEMPLAAICCWINAASARRAAFSFGVNVPRLAAAPRPVSIARPSRFPGARPPSSSATRGWPDRVEREERARGRNGARAVDDDARDCRHADGFEHAFERRRSAAAPTRRCRSPSTAKSP